MEVSYEARKTVAQFMGWKVKVVNTINSKNNREYREVHTVDHTGKWSRICPSTMWGTEEETIEHHWESILSVEYGKAGRYHKSWNNLMLTVDKIEELGYFVMINKWTSVYTGTDNERISITSVEGGTKLENTYKAILEFITWFNNKNL
jgi:hypothetical protein